MLTAPSGPRFGGTAAAPSTRWWALGLPVGLSLAVHALLAIGLAAVAWRLTSPPTEPPGGVEAFIAASTPAVPTPSTPTPEPPSPTAPIIATEPDGPRTTVVVAPSPGPAPALPPLPSGPLPSGAPPSGVGAALAEPPVKGAGVQFGGLTASRARSVVFVVDGSGPMLGALPMLKASVQRSAAALVPVQQFSVIVFRDASADNEAAGAAVAGVDIFGQRLLDATPRNLAKLADWLATINAKGRSNPLDGLRAAFALSPRPHVVFLLSRSIPRSHGGQWEGGTDAILRELDALNPIDPAIGRRRTIIKTLQFLEPDPTGTMQAIAATHGSAAAAKGTKGTGATTTEAATPDHRVLKLEELPR